MGCWRHAAAEVLGAVVRLVDELSAGRLHEEAVDTGGRGATANASRGCPVGVDWLPIGRTSAGGGGSWGGGGRAGLLATALTGRTQRSNSRSSSGIGVWF